MPRPISAIAREISRAWIKPNYAARPYLDAMHSIESITDSYYSDNARSIVGYFLGNASSWRGDVAKRLKAELRSL